MLCCCIDETTETEVDIQVPEGKTNFDWQLRACSAAIHVHVQ